ncbi:hypothetical protein [Haladaptatus sp. GCM10025893]|uniref:hypothetical protein n=1 Tax=Haladaptatus sp. GCM10025893 TaxID=3252659 RepID=UPI003622463D
MACSSVWSSHSRSCSPCSSDRVTDRRLPTFVAVYPNPLTADDAGEYVVIEFPTAKTGNWTLSDGETTVSLSRVNLAGPCALTAEQG